MLRSMSNYSMFSTKFHAFFRYLQDNSLPLFLGCSRRHFDAEYDEDPSDGAHKPTGYFAGSLSAPRDCFILLLADQSVKQGVKHLKFYVMFIRTY